MRVVTGIPGHRRVLGRRVVRLPGSTAPHVEVLAALIAFSLDLKAKLPGKCSEVAGFAKKHRIRFRPYLRLHVAMIKVAAGLVFVHPRHHVGTAGHADGCRVVVPVKDDTVAPQLVHVGCDHLRIAIATNRAKILVVRHQINDIGPRAPRRIEHTGHQHTQDRHMNGPSRKHHTPILLLPERYHNTI